MKIICHDNSSQKLYFAQELLWNLNFSDHDVYIEISDSDKKQYDWFLSFFENINFTKIEKEDSNDIIIDIIDDMDRISKNSIVYPIIPKSQTNEYEKIIQDKVYNKFLAPLDYSKKSVPFLTGNVRWVEDIIQKNAIKNDLNRMKILISAGPTKERIDPVRFMTNHSTGKMGIALAKTAYIRGADVTIVLGPTNEYVPEYLKIIRVVSAEQMANEIIDNFEQTDVYIGAAAIADFTPVHVQPDKIKKGKGEFQPQFKRTTDVLAYLKNIKKKQLLAGFSVETKNIKENSLRKLKQKDLDLIVVNNPQEEGAGFATDTNRVIILHRSGEEENLPLISKLKLADIILDRIKKKLPRKDH